MQFPPMASKQTTNLSSTMDITPTYHRQPTTGNTTTTTMSEQQQKHLYGSTLHEGAQQEVQEDLQQLRHPSRFQRK